MQSALGYCLIYHTTLDNLFSIFFIKNLHNISFVDNGNSFIPPQISTWLCQEKYWYPQLFDHCHNIFSKFLPVCWCSFNWAHKAIGFVFCNKTFYSFLKISAQKPYSNTVLKTIFPNSWNIVESSKIPSKYHLTSTFWIKRTVFSISEKFKRRLFPYSVNMVFHAKENIILLLFWELKDHLSQFSKYDASFVNTKERSSFYELPAVKKISLLIWSLFKRSSFSTFII